MKLYKKRSMLLSQLLLCKRSILNGYNIVIYSNDSYLIFNILDRLRKMIQDYNYKILEQKFIHDDIKFNHQISRTLYKNKYLITTNNLSFIQTTISKHKLFYINFNHI